MIKLTDENDATIAVAADHVKAIRARSAASSMRYKSIVSLQDGSVIYAQEDLWRIVEQVEAQTK